MATLVKKENIAIVIETYMDNSGQEKKKHRTIGELVTMRGDDGSEFQFGKLWGASGVTEIKVFSQDDSSAPKQQAPMQQPQPMQQQMQPQQAQRYDQYGNPV